jgi:hypothetical protein
MNMAYERFKTVMSPEEFFNEWKSENLSQIGPSFKQEIYNKYLLKCVVFQRDDFTCVNECCLKNGTDLQLHHIKFRKNNGKDSPRNAVTLCKTCHQGFHKGKIELTFNGATYKLHVPEPSIDWKSLKWTNRRYRKRLKVQGEFNVKISYEMWILLMKFLDIEYTDLLEDD